MVANDINIAIIGILISDKVGMILARQKLDIMLNEIALVDEIHLHNLFKDIFFGCQFCLPSLRLSTLKLRVPQVVCTEITHFCQDFFALDLIVIINSNRFRKTNQFVVNL